MAVGSVPAMAGWWKQKEILTRINAVEVVEIRCEPESLNCAVDVAFDMIGLVGNAAVLENSYAAL